MQSLFFPSAFIVIRYTVEVLGSKIKITKILSSFECHDGCVSGLIKNGLKGRNRCVKQKVFTGGDFWADHFA